MLLMNRQLKEIAEQAGYPDYMTYGQDLVLERFAELIVRECMKESMDEIVSDENIAQEKDPLIQEYLKGNNQGIVDAVVRFRNHFGVTE
jgi:hypothetical protein